jgi:flagellar M-ring protein FliF
MATDLIRNDRSGWGGSAALVQVGALWHKQSRLRRSVAVAVMIILVLATGWLALGARGTAWVVVVSAGHDREAHECVSELQRGGIAARLRERDVEVAPADLVRARTALAAAGLPDSHPGLHVFADASPMQSSFAEQANYKGALQDELARSIKALAPIDGARVHLAFGRRSLYKEQEQAPSASIVLHVRTGQGLTSAQVRGIRQVVASAVDGLRAEAVTVVDGGGAVLDSGDGDTTIRQVEIERTIASKVRLMLEQVVGQGKVAVVVTADMDLRQVEETAETYDRDRTALTSETRHVDREATQRGPGAELRPTSTPGESGVGPVGAASAAFASESRNYVPTRVITATKFPRARLQRLHLAVIVDYQRARNGVSVAPTEAELAVWAGLVRNAAGIDESRGDRIELKAAPFAPVEAQDLNPPGPSPGSTSFGARLGSLDQAVVAVLLGALVSVVLFGALLVRMRYRYGRRAAEAERKVVALSEQAAANERAMRPSPGSGADHATEHAIARAVEHAIERAIDAARADVHGTALVLSAWLAERDGATAEPIPISAVDRSMSRVLGATA